MTNSETLTRHLEILRQAAAMALLNQADHYACNMAYQALVKHINITINATEGADAQPDTELAP